MPSPKRVDPLNKEALKITWEDGSAYAVPYHELRFQCPCAVCVDEETGQRVIQRSSISSDIRVTGAHVVGRYALQFDWSDGHATGMYHFERLHELCLKNGQKLSQALRITP